MLIFNPWQDFCPFWRMNQFEDIFTTWSNQFRSIFSENNVSSSTSTCFTSEVVLYLFSPPWQYEKEEDDTWKVISNIKNT